MTDSPELSALVGRLGYVLDAPTGPLFAQRKASLARHDLRQCLAALSSAPVAGELDPATVEACAKVAADFYRGHGKTFRTPRAYAYEHAGKAIASAIRRELAASTPKDTGERGSGEARS